MIKKPQSTIEIDNYWNVKLAVSRERKRLRKLKKKQSRRKEKKKKSAQFGKVFAENSKMDNAFKKTVV